MKLFCNGKDLAEAVNKVSKALSARTTSPILEGIKLTATQGSLTLLATDTELSIEKRIHAEVLIEGEIVVPGKLFGEFTKRLDADRIELVLKEHNQLQLSYNESEVVLSAMLTDDYPVVPEIQSAQTFIIVQSEFASLINKVVFSVTSDDSRPILKGVLLEILGSSITAVALDGFRLARCSTVLEKSSADMRAVVPARALKEIASLLEGTDPVVVSIQKSYIMVDLKHTKLTSRLIDGDFINYKNIIPERADSVITVSREQLERALDRAVLLSRTDKNLVKFDIREGVMHLTANSQVGNVNERIAVKLTGPDITIAFNARYYLELLKYFSGNNITINCTTSVAPCTVRPTAPADGDMLYLVLPVRTQN